MDVWSSHLTAVRVKNQTNLDQHWKRSVHHRHHHHHHHPPGCQAVWWLHGSSWIIQIKNDIPHSYSFHRKTLKILDYLLKYLRIHLAVDWFIDLLPVWYCEDICRSVACFIRPALHRTWGELQTIKDKSLCVHRIWSWVVSVMSSPLVLSRHEFTQIHL